MLADISAGRTEAVLKRIAAGEDIHESDAFGTTPLMLAALTNQLDIMRALLPRHDLRHLQQDIKGLTAFHYAIQSDSHAALALFQDAGIDLLNQPNKIGATPLMVAARNGQINVVRYLLSLNRDDIREAVDPDGHSAVYYAVHGGQFNVLLTLHEAGLNLHQSNKKGTTPLMLAAKHSQANILRFLLSLNREDIKQAVDLEGYSPVHFAAQGGHVEVLQTLDAAGFDLNQSNKSKTTPLMGAAINGKINAVRYLLSLDREDIKQAVDLEGFSAAHFAAQADQVAVLQALHAAGVDLNKSNKRGTTPLMTAAINGKFNAVRYLLSLDREDIKQAIDLSDCSVAHYAATFGCLKTLRALEAAGINLYQPNNKGATPLMAAAAHGRTTALLYYLKELRADTRQVVDHEGLSAAHYAAEKGHADALRVLQAGGFDLNKANKLGGTPLMVAALNDRINAVRYLLSLNRADIKQVVDLEGYSAVHYAAQADHVAVLQALQAAGFDLNQASKTGSTPLMTAASNGKINAVRYLLSLNRADIKQAVNHEGLSAAHFAAEKGHADALRVLQAAGFDLNQANKLGGTPLMTAAINGRINAVRYLLSLKRADIKQAVDLEGYSAAHNAAQGGHVEVLQALQAAGFDLNQANKMGSTPLMTAAYKGKIDVVRYLLILNHAAMKKVVNIKGLSAVHYAAQAGHVEVFQALQLAGFDLNQANKMGATPLMTAAINGRINAVRYLLSLNRADIKQAVNIKKLSAAHYAAQGGHVEVLQALQAAGLDLNQANKNGVTPLMLAAFHGKTNSLRYLLSLNRADIKQAVNHAGLSAVHFAAQAGHVEALQALQAAGFDLNQANKLGVTPLMLALNYENIKVVRYLLSLNRDDIKQAVNLNGFSAAHFAAQSGLVETMQALDTAGLDLNQAGKNGSTPLMTAARNGKINTVRYLLSLNRDDIKQAVNVDGHSAAHYAAQGGHVEVLQVLDAAGFDLNKPSKMGATPLMGAAINGKIKALRYLLGLNRDDIKQAVDFEGYSAVHMAAQGGHVEALQVLQAAGLDLNKPSKMGATPLMLAAKTNQTKVLRYLLGLDRDDIKHAADLQGFAAVHVAAECGHVEALQVLQAAGLDLNKPSKMGATPLMTAASSGKINVLHYLLSLNRDDIKQAANPLGHSATHAAAESGHVEALKTLYAAGLDLNKPNKMGSTPLMTAASNGKINVLHYLLSLNRDDIKEAVDFEGYSAVYYAAESSQVEALQTLHAGGFDLNQRSKKGATPLIIATIYRNINAVRYLLSLNRDDIKEAVDLEGDSPVHFAAQAGHVDVLQTLHAAGLNINHPNKIGITPLMQLLSKSSKSPTSSDMTCVKWLLAHGATVNRGMNFQGRPIETFILEEAAKDAAWKTQIERQPNLSTFFEPAPAGAATYDPDVNAALDLLGLRTFTPMHQADLDAMDTSPDAASAQGETAEDARPPKRLRLSQY